MATRGALTTPKPSQCQTLDTLCIQCNDGPLLLRKRKKHRHNRQYNSCLQCHQYCFHNNCGNRPSSLLQYCRSSTFNCQEKTHTRTHQYNYCSERFQSWCQNNNSALDSYSLRSWPRWNLYKRVIRHSFDVRCSQ